MQSNCQKSSIMNISHTLKWVWNKLFLSCDVVEVIESLATWLNMMDSYFLPRFEVIWITITLFNCKNLDIRKFVFTKLFIHLQTNKQLWVCIPLGQGVSDTTLCDKVCQWLVTCRWFSPGTLVSSTNKTDCEDVTDIFLKVTLNTINLTSMYKHCL
jgi:hypothetical protein